MNEVKTAGMIVSSFRFDHMVLGEKFYFACMAVERNSGARDFLPIIASERLLDMSSNYLGNFFEVRGQLRTYRKTRGLGKPGLNIFVQEINPACKRRNEVVLSGFICRKGEFRRTASDREVIDFLLKANRAYGKADYIPCIAWGRNAKYVDTLEVGTYLEVTGRIQSREYKKKIAEDEYETRTAYEVSVQTFSVIEEGNVNENGAD